MQTSDGPAYVRLRTTIAAKILDGTFGDGDPLPSVRSLAVEHGLNPLTVAKAYQSFQDDGLVAVKRGVGMFVAPGASSKLLASERTVFLDQLWPEIVRHIRVLGLDPAELLGREIA